MADLAQAVEQRRTDVKLNLRLTKAQHRRLQQAAKENNSTLQREIVRRLEESFVLRPAAMALSDAAQDAFNEIRKETGALAAAVMALIR